MDTDTYGDMDTNGDMDGVRDKGVDARLADELHVFGCWYVKQEVAPCQWRFDLGVLGVPPGISGEQVTEAARRAGLARGHRGCFGPLQADYLVPADPTSLAARCPMVDRLISWPLLLELATRGTGKGKSRGKSRGKGRGRNRSAGKRNQRQ